MIIFQKEIKNKMLSGQYVCGWHAAEESSLP